MKEKLWKKNHDDKETLKEKAEKTAGKIKADVKHGVEAAKEKAHDVKENIKEGAEKVKEKIAEKKRRNERQKKSIKKLLSLKKAAGKFFSGRHIYNIKIAAPVTIITAPASFFLKSFSSKNFHPADYAQNCR